MSGKLSLGITADGMVRLSVRFPDETSGVYIDMDGSSAASFARFYDMLGLAALSRPAPRAEHETIQRVVDGPMQGFGEVLEEIATPLDVDGWRVRVAFLDRGTKVEFDASPTGESVHR